MIWLAWQKHRRTQSLCEYLGIPMYAETVSAGRVVRYAVLAGRSLRIIHVRRPRVLIVQNPSIVLCLLVILLRPLYRYKLVVDAHNEGVMPYANRSRPFLYLTNFILRKADYTIVTNRFLADVVRRRRGNPLVLPDGLPSLHPQAGTVAPAGDGRKVFLLICTHARDEPVQQIFDAVAHYRDEILLLVTGRNSTDILSRYRQVPDNVRFTGFLSDAEYLAALAGCDCVIDLTKMPYCLVCGAYEALAAGKPMILSEDPACRETFSRGTVYTRPETHAIRLALGEALSRLEFLTVEVADFRAEYEAAWKIQADRVIDEAGLGPLPVRCDGQ